MLKCEKSGHLWRRPINGPLGHQLAINLISPSLNRSFLHIGPNVFFSFNRPNFRAHRQRCPFFFPSRNWQRFAPLSRRIRFSTPRRAANRCPISLSTFRRFSLSFLKVYRGETVMLDTYLPWMAFILGPSICTATIISRNYVLSAGHCVNAGGGKAYPSE